MCNNVYLVDLLYIGVFKRVNDNNGGTHENKEKAPGRSYTMY